MTTLIATYFADTEYFEDVIVLGQYLICVNITLWYLSLRVGKAWPVDFIWATWPILQLTFFLYEDCSTGYEMCDYQPLIHLIVVIIWGARLTTNFIRRGGIGHEDWRYTDMRTQFGDGFFGYNLISFFTVFLAQSTFMYCGCLPLFVIARSPEIPLTNTILGAALSLLGVTLEYIADQQMDVFNQQRKEKKTTKKVLTTGLWQYSRHPNYCGELFFWWGTYIASISVSPLTSISIGIVGPVLMTLLFFGISVDLMEKRQLQNKPKEYKEYIQNVPSSILLLPSFQKKTKTN